MVTCNLIPLFVHKCMKNEQLSIANYKERNCLIVDIFTGGILTFLILEKIFEYSEDESAVNNNKGDVSEKKKKIIGYLNLMANCIDNFIHGLAVASRYLRRNECKIDIVSRCRYLFIVIK